MTRVEGKKSDRGMLIRCEGRQMRDKDKQVIQKTYVMTDKRLGKRERDDG